MLHGKTKPLLQAKLTVDEPGDMYEQEADAMADRIMRMSSNEVVKPATGLIGKSLQRKCAHCEEEEEKRKKPVMRKAETGHSGITVSSSFAASLNASKGSGSPLPHGTRSFMENAFSADFSRVKIHTNGQASEMNKEIHARAFTYGNDIYFNEGQYFPNSDSGKSLLAHELTHTVQQKSGKLIQRYFEANGSGGTGTGNNYRVSDDLTAAVKVGYPNHDLYAEAGKAADSTRMLAGVGSGIMLVEEGSTFDFYQGTTKKNLKKVVPLNVQNLTSGDDMKISDDCGTSCSVVVGSKKRTALHYDALTKTHAKTGATTPSLMKAEIMKKMLQAWLISSATSAPLKTEIIDTIAKADAKQLEINTAKADFNAATTAADIEAKSDIYWAKVDEYGDIMMSFYNKMSEPHREEIDKYLEINKFANPNVGQGYTMSSGGNKYPGYEANTWNFHWGGVVMKSNDQQDTVTLENYAVAGNVENKKWDFAMYGTAATKGQTFHEQHHNTKQHGDRPTTMKIEKI